MADKTDDLPAGSDKTTTSSDKRVEDDITTKVMNEVWDNLSWLGIGPHARTSAEGSTLTPGAAQPEGPKLPPLEVFDQTPTITAQTSTSVESPLKLPPPPTRIKTENITMDIYPTVNPGKKEVALNVEGEF